MKTMNLLRVLMASAFMVLIANVAMGQPYKPYVDMVEASALSVIDSVTGGVDVPYYVEPDAVLNTISATYDPTDVTGQGLYSTWVWSFDAAQGAVSSQGLGGDGVTADGPYVEVTWTAPAGAPAEDTLYVQEVGSTGCAGTISKLVVHVFDAPAFTPGAQSVDLCDGDSTNYVVSLSSIADNYVNRGNHKIRIDINVDNLTPALALDANVRQSFDTIIEIPVVGGDGAADADEALITYTMVPINGKITRYTFDFGTNAGLGLGAEVNGITDPISRKTDYLTNSAAVDADWTYYSAAAVQKVFTVYPAPTTGSIFFIGNDFDL